VEQDPVMVLVGIYGSEADAQPDYDDVKLLDSFSTFGIFDAAVITKDGDGRVRVDKDEKTTRQGAGAARIRDALDGREPEHVTR